MALRRSALLLPGYGVRSTLALRPAVVTPWWGVAPQRGAKKKGGAQPVETAASGDAVDLKEVEGRMEKTMEAFRRSLGAINLGRPNPKMLNSIQVDLGEGGGTQTLAGLGQVTVASPQQLLVNLFDPSVGKQVRAALLHSELRLESTLDGAQVRVQLPRVTAEYKTQLIRQIGKDAEAMKVSMRRIRQDVMQSLKGMEKSVGKDEVRRLEKDVQEMLDKRIKDLEKHLDQKKTEIEQTK